MPKLDKSHMAVIDLLAKLRYDGLPRTSTVQLPWDRMRDGPFTCMRMPEELIQGCFGDAEPDVLERTLGWRKWDSRRLWPLLRQLVDRGLVEYADVAPYRPHIVSFRRPLDGREVVSRIDRIDRGDNASWWQVEVVGGYGILSAHVLLDDGTTASPVTCFAVTAKALEMFYPMRDAEPIGTPGDQAYEVGVETPAGESPSREEILRRLAEIPELNREDGSWVTASEAVDYEKPKSKAEQKCGYLSAARKRALIKAHKGEAGIDKSGRMWRADPEKPNTVWYLKSTRIPPE